MGNDLTTLQSNVIVKAMKLMECLSLDLKGPVQL